MERLCNWRKIINKEEFLLSIPDSISLTEAVSDVALAFTKVSLIYRKKSQADLEKYICFHKELKWGVYKHEDRYFLVNIRHPKKSLGIESKATLVKVTEVLTDADDDSYLEKASIKGNNVFIKTSDSEKLFLQTITEYDSKQQAFKAEELVTQIKAKRKAEEERRIVGRKEEKKSSTEPTEVVTVTLSKNHKTFKTESGDYRLERYKDGKIKAFKDDQVCSNTKNVLRAINKEYKLEFTSGDFKKMHTRKLGKEIIENMKDSAKELEMSTEPPDEERKAADAAAVEAPSGTLFSEEEVEEVAEAKVKKEDNEEDEKDEKDEVEEVVKPSIPKTKVSLLRSMINNAISLLLLFVSWLPLIFVTPLGIEGETISDWWVVGIIISLGYVFTVMIIESKRTISKITSAILSSTFIVVPMFVIWMWWSFWSGWNIAGASMLVLVSLSLRIMYGKDRRNDRAEAKRRGISIEALHEEREAAAAAEAAAAKKERATKRAAAKKEEAKKRAAAEKEYNEKRAAEVKERAKQRAAAEKKRQEARRKLVKQYGEAVVAAFEQGRVCLDMSKAMVTKIKGEPDEVKRSVTKRGEKLQYFYAAKYSSGALQTNRQGNVILETRIDFVNGVVTGLKDL